ncbi:hypothetical protein ACIODS_16995 [Micromonospora chalcea]|uniref:hypothetical protein n=1 Tax=Micromonospora TaxID=1873 RepID=UPI00068C42E4|nr:MULTISPECIES: hypothetical protein [Micromonospora]
MTDLVSGSWTGSAALASADAALVELRDGRIGPAALELLRRLGRQCTRSSRTNFPPPEGYGQWSDDAVDHLLADMFARPDADNPDECHKFVLDCYARSTNGPSLERLLLAAIENFLKDEAKKTERGKLRRRLTGLLQKDPRFTECGGDRWGLASGSHEPWQGDLAALERAAFAVRGVELSTWNHAGPTPRATVSALLIITEAVLVEARGRVRTEDLARVLQTRFRLLRVPYLVSFDDETTGLAEVPDGGRMGDVKLRARQFFDGLTQSERRLLPFLAERQRWSTVLDVGPATARATGQALIEKVRLATVDDADHEEVVLELVRLCGRTDAEG